MNFKGKKVAVLGFGQEGASAANFLLEKGAIISIFDVRPQDKFEESKISEFKNKGVSFGFDSYPKDFSEFDLVFRSPGISPLSSVIQRVKAQGVEVTSVTKIFFDLCPCPIIGVTGTKGKGTTSSLIYEMLKKQGFDAYLGGNIGLPPLEFHTLLKHDSWVVLELSSFQLQDLTKSPKISVLLMITSEHLDYHRDVKEYTEAKRNILRYQAPSDFAVINRDYPGSNESDIHTQGQVYYVSREREVERGCFVEDGKIVLVTDNGYGNEARMAGGLRQTLPKNLPAGKAGETGIVTFKRQTIIDVKDILLPGRHNWENACAASMAAYLAGVEIQNIAGVLKEFKGLEHRLELVRIFNGVRYYDDSFSTTPETAAAAIEAFVEPEILILGGSSKNSDFTYLGKVIREAKNIKAIIGIGEEWPRIKFEIRNSKFEFPFIEGCKNMKEIVEKAREIAEVGDVVLLSPACASFDMFPNYKERGRKFKHFVNLLR